MTSTAPLEAALDEDRFGGKAVTLGAALRGDLPVPRGVALSVELVADLAAGARAAESAVEAVYAALGGPVAARSSAVGEDSAAASFAGQHLTQLHVTSAPSLVAAVRRVWSSARSEPALAYRRRLGVAGEPRVGVVVQRMVSAVCAGVLFTRDPVTGSDERVVEAAWGLGEAVVAGLVTPDSYRLDRAGRVLSRRAGDKDLAVVPSAEGGTAEVPVDAARARALCLGDGDLARLHALALGCERTFGDGPHDLEWALAADQLYLLQRRAVTSAPGPGAAR